MEDSVLWDFVTVYPSKMMASHFWKGKGVGRGLGFTPVRGQKTFMLKTIAGNLHFRRGQQSDRKEGLAGTGKCNSVDKSCILNNNKPGIPLACDKWTWLTKYFLD